MIFEIDNVELYFDDKAILKLRRTIKNNPYSDDANAASAVLKDLELL